MFDNLEQGFMKCISPLKEKYVQDKDIEGTRISDKNVVLQTGSAENFELLDNLLTGIGLKDVSITEIIEEELHFYLDYPKFTFSGQGVYALLQFNVE